MVRILDFYMDNCVPCNQLKEVLSAYENVEFIKSSENLDLVLKYNIRKAPTVIILKSDVEVIRLSGYKTKEEIDKFLEGLN